MTSLKFFLLLLVGLAMGCENLGIGTPKITADISTPKSAALAYLKAIDQGDARMARALSFGTSEQKRWVDGRATFVDGLRKFDDALYAKFGHFTSQVHTDMHDMVMKTADIWITSISDGPVSADDNQAVIQPAHAGFFSRGVKPVQLRHFKEGWKVDLAETYAPKASPEEIQAISAEAEQWRQVGEVFKDVSRNIKAGLYHTADEATDALGNRLKALQDNP